MLEIIVHDGTIVAPRIAAEQFVTASPGQHHLAELSRQLRGVEIRIALADPWLLEMVGKARHHALHVTRF